MIRLIPGKTKVEIELFRGVTLGDVVIAGLAITMLIFIVLSSLPWKFGICIGVACVTGMLLVRIDEQANYIYLLHILSHFGYDRHFARTVPDQLLLERGQGTDKEAAIEQLFSPEKKTETARERKARLKAQRAAEKQKAVRRKKRRRREDKILKSRKATEEQKEAIRERRRREEDEEAVEAAWKAVEKSAAYRASEPPASASSDAAPAEAEASPAKMTRKERKRAKKAAKRAAKAEKLAKKTAAKEKKAAKKEKERLRKEEDEKLKSRTVPEEEKAEIRERRAAESAEAMRRMAEAKDAAEDRKSMDELVGFTDIRDGCIVYGKKEYYGAAIEIDPVEFRFFSEHRRTNSIEGGIGRILRSVGARYSANIVKLERPIRYESFLEKEYGKLYELRGSYESGMLTEEELKARVEIEYDRINELLRLCGGDKVVTAFYYLVLFESDRRQLEMAVSNALVNLGQGEMTAHRLNDKELAVFLKYSNALDFDENEIEQILPEDYAQWAKPSVVDIKARRVEVNHIITHNLRVVNYPSQVGDAWLAGVMSFPATKVVVKARPMDRAKSIRAIDRSLVELRGQWSATGIDSKRMEIEEHLGTLQNLLSTLQSDNESLLEVNIYITCYDIYATRNNYKIKQPGESALSVIADMKKTVRRAWQESGFRLGNMEFDQLQAFIGGQISGLDPLANQGRGIPSNTIAACYPWIYAHISDEGGVKLGENDGIPVFINFFRRDNERVNSNMVIVGKSGSGKSYATKSILANLAADDAKIFILDPENEYTELAGNLHGKIINVGNAQHGRLNPFHIITALEDDEAGENGPSGSYATHLQFLEEFFKQILPDCEKDALEYLNTLLDRVYFNFNITPETNLSRLKPSDYPVFDDLYDEILQEFQRTDNQYIRTMLRTLMNYIAKFSTGGRNANIWNGPSTVTTDTNFTVFNFQSMLANRNTTIANAQMLLVLKYIDNEIIKNRDYNMKYGLNRKVVVVIDEAHVFIDTKFPIALDFMFQLAKRIRKYNGMQIVITQNIKDFVGSEEIARKSTAIINACQYSFIFSLAPNDIQDLVQLYANAGGINENEQEQIVQAPRGQAFTIMSPTSRSTFRVQTGQSMISMFEDRSFTSRYFTGGTGAQNWEDFIAGSREAHDAVMLDRYEERDEETEAQPRQSSVFLEETSGSEYDFAEFEEMPSGGSGYGGVTLIEEEESAPVYGTVSDNWQTPPLDASASKSGAGSGAEEAVEKLANVLADTLQRAVAAPAPAAASADTEENRGAMLADIQRTIDSRLAQEREELRREREELRAMMDRFQSLMSSAETPMAGPDYAAAPQYAARPDYQAAPDYAAASQYAAVPDYQAAPDYAAVPQYAEAPDYQAAPEYAAEEPSAEAEEAPARMEEFDLSAFLFRSGEGDMEEEEQDTEAAWEPDESFSIEPPESGGGEEDSGWISEDEADGENEDKDEYENEGEDEDEDDEEEDEDGAFDLTAFLNRTVQQTQTMSVVDRMRREGKDSMEITLEDLTEYLESIKKV